VRAGVDALLTAQAEAAWKTWTTGEPSDPAAAWAGREALASPQTLALIAEVRAETTEADRPGLDRLRAFLLGEQLARAAAEPIRALAAARAGATFTWEKRVVPLRLAPALLAAEAEAPRRKALADAHAAAAAKLRPLVAAREAALSAAAARAGLSGPLELAAVLRGEDVDAMAALAEATLARTETTWRALLEALARRELQTPPDRLRERDLPRLLRTTALPGAFPATRLLPDAEATLQALGLDLGAGGHLTVDAEARPVKIPRPLAVPVEVPGVVRLSLTPMSGLDAARALLGELGVAQAAARITAPAVEDRRLGADALTEAWRTLFASVAASPAWLAAHGLDAEAAQREARVAAARRLHTAREAAARVLVEIARARDPSSLAARWAALAPRALGHPIDAREPPPGATDPDPTLGAVEALRAALLAAQVEAHLSTLGNPWWRSPAAGAWLAKAWAGGARRSPTQLARSLGATGLDPAALDAVVRAGAREGGLDLPAAAISTTTTTTTPTPTSTSTTTPTPTSTSTTSTPTATPSSTLPAPTG
jgi:hypothetical protein